jgi:phospholipid/cholesterol/gamma-HCH transport system substrate-binding protein
MKFAAETKVGMVVLLSIVVLTYMTFKLGGGQFGEVGYRLSAVFPNASGLDARAPVQMSGVEIGRVESVSLAEGGAKVVLLIRNGVAIRAGGFAAIEASGLLGDRFVSIEQGKDQTLLKDGDRLPVSSERVSFDQLTGQVSDLIERFVKITDDVQAVTASLRGAFGGEEGEQALGEILQHIRSLTKGIDQFVSANRSSMGRSISNLEQFSKTLKEEGDGLFKSLGAVVKKVESGEGTVGKLIYDQGAYDKLSSALNDLGESLKSVQTITAKVERGDGTIGKLISDDKVYQNLNTALEGVSGTLGRIQKFKTEVGFRNEYQLDAGENKGYFSLKVSPRIDRYYLLEVVDDPRGTIRLTDKRVTTNGVPVTISELETSQKMKFSALFGKRYPDIGLRIGLMESGFGLGTDFYAHEDRFRFSLDAWDFGSNDIPSKEPRLKVAAQVDLFSHVHLSAGYDQILNPALDTPFIGIGLRFEDDDLKYILGVLK